MIDHRLHRAGQHADLGVHAFEQEVGPQRRRVDIGLQIFAAGLGQAGADLRRRVTRQALHVPQCDAAAEQHVEQDGRADDENEFAAKAPGRKTQMPWRGDSDVAHCGLVPDATQIGQPV